MYILLYGMTLTSLKFSNQGVRPMVVTHVTSQSILSYR